MRVNRVTRLHLILYSMHNAATYRQWVMLHSNTPPVKRGHVSSPSPSTTPEHQTAEQYSETGRTNPGKYLPRSNLSWNIRQDILEIPSLWEAALETEKIHLKGDIGIKCHSQYIKVIRLLHHSSANSYWGNWECIVHDLETIIVSVSLEFNFISQKSLHSRTLPRSRFRDSATV